MEKKNILLTLIILLSSTTQAQTTTEIKQAYTISFYLALAALGILILIILLFIYLFFKKPKNKWEQQNTTRGTGINIASPNAKRIFPIEQQRTTKKPLPPPRPMMRTSLGLRNIPQRPQPPIPRGIRR